MYKRTHVRHALRSSFFHSHTPMKSILFNGHIVYTVLKELIRSCPFKIAVVVQTCGRHGFEANIPFCLFLPRRQPTPEEVDGSRFLLRCIALKLFVTNFKIALLTPSVNVEPERYSKKILIYFQKRTTTSRSRT